ncbi:MAG: hypothetical protein KIG59_01055, partial [Muribaculaceae bacterium]|nr:hypothetical protein [Muribaculaceae bacterium]
KQLDIHKRIKRGENSFRHAFALHSQGKTQFPISTKNDSLHLFYRYLVLLINKIVVSLFRKLYLCIGQNI